jgi:hypothetical protein
MSRQPENTFIASVRKHLPPSIYVMKNNNIYNAGIPDLWLSGPGGDLWIEVKFVVLPKRDDTTITPNLSELQKDWLRRRHSEGRKLGVIVGSKEGGVWFPNLAWENPLKTVEFRKLTMSRSDLAAVITKLIQ